MFAALARCIARNTVKQTVNVVAEKAARVAVETVADKAIDRTIDALFKHPRYPFIAGGQLYLMEKGVSPKRAWNMAAKTLIEWLADEKIQFGDNRYSWNGTAGREIIAEYWAER